MHIITRRLFDGDVRRHFVGEVTGVSGELTEVRGYAFVFDPGINLYRKRPELRTRILGLGESGFIVNKIPQEVAINSVEYRLVEGRSKVTDGLDFVLDVDEFGRMS